MEQTQTSQIGRVGRLSRRVVKSIVAQVKKSYEQLKQRYGPRYTKVMVAAAFFALFVPLPGILLLAVALVVVIAEFHRTISRRAGLAKTSAKEIVMSMNCDAILRWDATPAELAKLGAALWRWCTRAEGVTGTYQYLDNQAMADLIAGKLPVPSHPQLGRVHFKFRDQASNDRDATIDRLRQVIPDQGVADILVDGKSWKSIDSTPGFRPSSGFRAGTLAASI